jgi:succinate dehydrogenase hydrophobic anchor subunit
MDNKTEKKWYQKPTAVVLLLIFFFPVGLYLMWKHEVWSKTARWTISAVFT